MVVLEDRLQRSLSDDLAAVSGTRIVIVVSEGQESCRGDPEAAVRSLVDRGFDVSVNIVGLGLDKKARRKISRLAAVGGGAYYDARDAAGLEAALRRLPARNRTWIVFAAMRDKDLKGVVEPFAASAAGWFVAQASTDRGATGEELATLLESLGAARVHVAADVAAACAAARAATAPADRVVVYGSFHTVGAALEALRLYCAPSPLVDRRSTWTRD